LLTGTVYVEDGKNNGQQKENHVADQQQQQAQGGTPAGEEISSKGKYFSFHLI